MWALIFSAMILAAGVSAVYLVSRFYKFAYTGKFSGGHKGKRILFAVLPVAVVLVLLKVLMGTINTMIILIHLMVIWFLCDMVNAVIKKKRGAESKRYYAGVIAIAVTAVYLSAGWYLAHNVWRTAYTVSTEKGTGDIRIVQFADSHVGTTFDGDGFAKEMEKIQKENPDIVVVTGDYVDDDTSREDMVTACRALGSIKTTYGVYFAMGNHDKGYYGPEYRGYSGDDLIAELEKNGVNVLEDESVLIDNRFYVIGRKDRSEEQGGSSRMEMKELVQNLDAGKYMIVLDHQPHDYAAQAEAKVDLVLSGHTHGGQLFPINYFGEWFKENEKTYGLEKKENTNFIVTSGISDWAISFKTGCKSEYVVIDVKDGSGNGD